MSVTTTKPKPLCRYPVIVYAKHLPALPPQPPQQLPAVRPQARQQRPQVLLPALRPQPLPALLQAQPLQPVPQRARLIQRYQSAELSYQQQKRNWLQRRSILERCSETETRPDKSEMTGEQKPCIPTVSFGGTTTMPARAVGAISGSVVNINHVHIRR